MKKLFCFIIWLILFLVVMQVQGQENLGSIMVVINDEYCTNCEYDVKIYKDMKEIGDPMHIVGKKNEAGITFSGISLGEYNVNVFNRFERDIIKGDEGRITIDESFPDKTMEIIIFGREEELVPIIDVNIYSDFQLTDPDLLKPIEKQDILEVGIDSIVLTPDNEIIERLSPGDILSSNYGDGFFRKVLYIESIPKQEKVVVGTEDASITDVVEKGFIHFQGTLKPDNTEQSIERIKINKQSLWEFEDEFNKSFNDKDGDTLKIFGQYFIKTGHEFDVDFDLKLIIFNSKLEHFLFKIFLEEKLDLSVLADMNFEDKGLSASIPISKFSPIEKVIARIAGKEIKLKFVPRLSIELGGIATADGEIHVDVMQNAKIESKIEYDGEKWNNKPLMSENDIVPALQKACGSCNLHIFANVKFDCSIAGIRGPFARAGGYLDFVADVENKRWWELYGGLRADVGIERIAIPFLDLEVYKGETIKLIDKGIFEKKAEGAFNPPSDCDPIPENRLSRQLHNGPVEKDPDTHSFSSSSPPEITDCAPLEDCISVGDMGMLKSFIAGQLIETDNENYCIKLIGGNGKVRKVQPIQGDQFCIKNLESKFYNLYIYKMTNGRIAQKPVCKFWIDLAEPNSPYFNRLIDISKCTFVQ